ncbi:hypothetical protein HpBT0363_02410 [Helicobacter pylori]
MLFSIKEFNVSQAVVSCDAFLGDLWGKIKTYAIMWSHSILNKEK